MKSNLANVKRYYRRLKASGGGKVTVAFQAKELEAIAAMSAYREPIARTVRRVLMEAAYDKGLVEAIHVPPRMEMREPLEIVEGQ